MYLPAIPFYETNVEKEKTKELVTGPYGGSLCGIRRRASPRLSVKSGENGANELTIMNLSSGKTRTVTGKKVRTYILLDL